MKFLLYMLLVAVLMIGTMISVSILAFPGAPWIPGIHWIATGFVLFIGAWTTAEALIRA